MNLLQKISIVAVANASSFALIDAILINGNDYYPVGLLRPSTERIIEVDCDSVRVAFKVDRIIEDWVITGPMAVTEIVITDSTSVVNVDIDIK